MFPKKSGSKLAPSAPPPSGPPASLSADEDEGALASPAPIAKKAVSKPPPFVKPGGASKGLRSPRGFRGGGR